MLFISFNNCFLCSKDSIILSYLPCNFFSEPSLKLIFVIPSKVFFNNSLSAFGLDNNSLIWYNPSSNCLISSKVIFSFINFFQTKEHKSKGKYTPVLIQTPIKTPKNSNCGKSSFLGLIVNLSLNSPLLLILFWVGISKLTFSPLCNSIVISLKNCL